MGNLINIYTLQKSVGLIVGGEKEEGVENNSLGSFLGGEMNSNIGNRWTKFRESTLGKTRNYICGVLQYSWSSLLVQLVNNLPAIRET